MKLLKDNNIVEIVDILKREGVLAVPTDTIYGFSSLVSEKAVSKIIELKDCSDDKLFILLVGKDFPLDKLVVLDENVRRFVYENTPNPVTMIFKKNPKAKLSSQFKIDTLAVRIPDDPFLQELLKSVGFLISTSCNKHGQPSLDDPQLISEEFASLDAIVERTACQTKKKGKASTIVDLTSPKLRIIRQGDYIVKIGE